MNEFKYLFHQGTQYRAYDNMGAHFVTEEGNEGVRFTVWAPHALSVSVIGDFNRWDPQADPMEKISEQGLYSKFIQDVKEFDSYKYKIIGRNGNAYDKADPYGYHFETRPGNASKVYSIEGYQWKDELWMDCRKNKDIYKTPINIYEVHAGSWKRTPDGSFLNFRELADELVPYVKKLGFTHIEFMPLAEHPLDDSWGYQVTGYYAATSRFGTPKDLMYLVDVCHQNGIGVIMDWVPAHFPKDAAGLYMFDGEPCYEYEDNRKGEHREWGTAVFDFGRNEVQSFLVSNAVFWFEKYHMDGLRVDAVASMLYLDYGRDHGEWMPNINGGKENLEAVAFLKKLNTEVFARFDNVIMAAEESTAWPGVTGDVKNGGLGFNFKWNMGWMNDVLSYIVKDPVYRKYHHDRMTFPMCYAYTENYILPISHDEVVYGKGSLLNKMPGNYEEKFAGMRTFLGFMMAHPGRKLMFMSGEFAQFKEWDHRRGIETQLMRYDLHRMMFEYVSELNHFYFENHMLWENDRDWQGFTWSCSDRESNILAFIRIGYDGSQMLCVYNFAPVYREDYIMGVPEGWYIQVFSSDEKRFGGLGTNMGRIEAIKGEINGFQYFIKTDIPPNSAVFFKKE
ncbi:MAG: 1,4-alpha-glucan branching protein GlgB [Clostridiales bacterium]|nr:1,4-alpha-glucan branching protein GlgB [Clostridiales bacterium]